MQSIGSQIRALRTKSGMTQKELAQKLGKSESAVRMWELDKSEPRISELRKLAAIFDTSVDWILGIIISPKKQKTLQTDLELELHFLRLYDRQEIAAMESVSQIIKWDNGGRTKTFPFAKEEAEQIVTDLLEVLFWRCGGMRELFFSNPEYRQERMRRGNSPDMMTLDIADKIAELIKEVC